MAVVVDLKLIVGMSLDVHVSRVPIALFGETLRAPVRPYAELRIPKPFGARYCFRDSHSGRNGPEAILRGRRARFVSQLAAPLPFSAAMARALVFRNDRREIMLGNSGCSACRPGLASSRRGWPTSARNK